MSPVWLCMFSIMGCAWAVAPLTKDKLIRRFKKIDSDMRHPYAAKRHPHAAKGSNIIRVDIRADVEEKNEPARGNVDDAATRQHGEDQDVDYGGIPSKRGRGGEGDFVSGDDADYNDATGGGAVTPSSSDSGVSKRKKVAIATFLFNDPPSGQLASLDGAGVLAESIRMHMSHLRPDLLAIVTPEVKAARPRMEAFGYTVIEFPTPDLTKIKNEVFRKEVVKDGCCGAAEMLKVEPYRMEGYDRIVVMDTDMLVLDSFEELLNQNYTTIYTSPFEKKSNEPLQGAFLVIRPDANIYDEVMSTWYEGDFNDSGWKNSGIGWNYGGRTIQGFLPYYLQKMRPESDAVRVDHCIYNHNGAKTNEYCEGRDFHQTKVAHFTMCQKPWYCFGYHADDEEQRACYYLTQEWWKVRGRLAQRLSHEKNGPKSGNVTPCDQYTPGKLSPTYIKILPEP